MVSLCETFQRLVLAEVRQRCPEKQIGRPKSLSDEVALTLIFKVLRTGMQWRELDSPVHYTTVFRRLHAWSNASVFDAAYKRALCTHKNFSQLSTTVSTPAT